MKRSALISVLFFLFICSANAAPFADPGQQFLEQEKRKKEQQLMEKKPAEIEAPKLSLPEEKGKKDAPCFQVHTIQLEGAAHLPKKTQSRLSSPYLHSCMDVATINRLIHEITNAYIALGYVTSRTYIPQQNLQSGVLKLTVIEGKIEKIQLNDAKKWKEKMQVKTAFPHLEGKLLRMKDLEQGVDQMNRLPSNNVKLTLWPGEAPGTSLVKLENQPHDIIRLSAAYDNYGQEATGLHRVRASAELDNSLGVNDTASFHYIGSLDTNTLATSLSVPYGYWTASLDASYSEYLSIIDNAVELFGTSYNTNMTLNRVVYRGQRSKTAVEAMLNIKESTRMIGTELLAPQPLTVARIGGTHMIRTESNVWNFNAHYSRGLSVLGAEKDQIDDEEAPRAQFDKFDGSVTLFQPLGKSAQLRTTLHGQYSFDSLYNSEQITLGDNSTVRGFSQSNISGDSGLYNQNEISFALPGTWSSALPGNLGESVQPYMFVDGGYTKIKTDHVYSPIIGTGGGVRFNLTQYINGDLSVAVPLHAGGRAEGEGAEIYVMVGMRW